jgi:Hypothetical protein (DUF2513)
MRRDWDLTRKILLKIESDGPSHGLWQLEESDFPEDDFELVHGHFRVLYDGGFLLVNDFNFTQIYGLSWFGHEFLDTIRDDEIWKNTKKTAIDLKNFSVETLRDIAKGYARKKLKDLTGMELS